MKARLSLLTASSVAFGILVGATLMGVSNRCGAQTLRVAPAQSYSPQLAAEREDLLRQMYLAHKCMYSASVAMFRQGVTERGAVTGFTVKMCASGLGVVFDRAGVSREDAGTMLVAMSDRAYDDAISWGRR